ncbi:MAG: hypothetical protein J6Z00_03945 [Clostridia bacterium]|nr:hypothetical protein [Clostridia bacterium]
MENPKENGMALRDNTEAYAFSDCENLQELIIEGDLLRVANWDKKAFAHSPCEETYLKIRNRE